MKADEILAEGAKTFAERNVVYGNNYLEFGFAICFLFPKGLPPYLKPQDWNRLGLLVQCVSKLSRYCNQFEQGGHKDSAHDLMVYAAMLQEITE